MKRTAKKISGKIIQAISDAARKASAVEATFPEKDLNLCVVDQIRSATKYAPFTDKKGHCRDGWQQRSLP
jgi:hypothetical protein